MTTSSSVKHATLVFEQLCAAPVERVFSAFASATERESWGAPSDTVAFIYDSDDFREGGQDVFRCGDKQQPQYRGVTTYLDIVPNERIVASEVIETAGRKLGISLLTTTLTPEHNGTKVTLTAQLTSLAGDDMISGAKLGHRASLANLAKAVQSTR
jgi:uncharacterized protein YndB with AHSA1/START domain